MRLQLLMADRRYLFERREADAFVYRRYWKCDYLLFDYRQICICDKWKPCGMTDTIVTIVCNDD